MKLLPYALLVILCVVLALAIVSTSDAKTNSTPVEYRMPYKRLANVADAAIRLGHVHSHRWGDATPWLRRLCYEMVRRQFRPYGTDRWAVYVVRRESGCNPAAINSTSGTTGIAQIHPRYHTWVNYNRVQRDMRYALATFVRLSRGGHNTRPWCLCG